MSEAPTSSGVRLELAGNRPLVLDDPSAAWLVDAGSVYVFAVPADRGRPVGGREYVARLAPGDAVFGMDASAAEVVLVAVGQPGTSLTPLDDGPDERMIEGWVRTLTSAFGPAGRDAIELAGDAAVETGDLPAGSGGFTIALARFHRTALEALGRHVDDVAAARTARSRARRAADDALLDAGLRDLLNFFEDGGHSADGAHAVAAGIDPLLAACRVVGADLGVAIEAPPAWQVASRDPLAAIARASHLRMRQVTLDGEWWRSAAGPLVGFRIGTDTPVALVPTSATAYRLVDPTVGTPTRVTADVAASLSAVAYTIYRPFPPRALGVGDLLRFGLRGGRRDIATIVVMGVLGGLLALVVPIATGLLFTTFIPGSDHGGVVQVALAMAASVLAITAFQLTRSIAVARLGARLDQSLEAAVWDRLLDLPVPFFRDYSSGDLALRATSISAMRRVLSGVVTTAVLGAGFSVFSVVLLYAYDATLAVVATLLLVAALVVGFIALVVQVRDRRRATAVVGRQIGLVLEMLNGIAKLRVAGAESRAFAVWARLVAGASARRAQLVAVQVNVVYAALPLIALVVIFPLAVGGATELDAGTFLAFNAALTQVIVAVVALGSSLSAVAQVVPLYERVKPILAALPEIDGAHGDPGELRGDIELSDVSFRYVADGPPVLEHVSFHAAPGQFVALVGPSGSGKSTILRLLLGFEVPEVGSIHLDAQDLATLDVQAVRRQMGVVLQSGKLAAGSIYQNIVGSSPFTVDDAWDAATSAGLDEDIRHMPMGMHTMVMEGGGGLSGGQRQRLLIARAIVAKPRILLFDEATSALDNRTQAVVTDSLDRLDTTRIVIAHRLSTVIDADQIHVVDAGRIVESGTYEQLMANDGPFAALAKRQLA